MFMRKKADPRAGTAHGAKDAIRKAAAAVFAERGFRGATVRAICSAAGANIALVSRYFGSKAALYADVCRNLFEGLGAPLARLHEKAVSPETWREAVREWISKAIAVTSAAKPPASHVVGIFRREMVSPSPMHAYLKREFMKPVFDSLRRLVEMVGSHGEEETLGWLAAIWSRTTIFALLDETWQKPFKPASLSRAGWLARTAGAIADDVFKSLSFRAETPRP